MDIEEKKLKAHWKRLKKVHLILIIVIIGMVILISIIFSFNPIVVGLGILGSIASIIGLKPSSIEEKFETISKQLKNFDPLERDRLIKELKEKNEVLETALKDERAGNTKERKEALNALKKNNPTKAQKLFKRRIEKDKVDLAENYFNLGNAYFVDLKFKKALDAYLEAEKFDQVNTNYLNSIGLTYDELAAHKKAISYYEKALASDLKTYGDSHPTVAIRWNNLGSAWDSLGDYKKAIESLKKALHIFENTLSSNHPTTKRVKENVDFLQQKVSAYR